MLAAAQRIGPGGDGGGEAERFAGLLPDLAAQHRRFDQAAVGFAGTLVAQAQVGEFGLLVSVEHDAAFVAQRRQACGIGTDQRDLVQRGDLVPRADVAGVDLVVGEVLARQHPAP